MEGEEEEKELEGEKERQPKDLETTIIIGLLLNSTLCLTFEVLNYIILATPRRLLLWITTNVLWSDQKSACYLICNVAWVYPAQGPGPSNQSKLLVLNNILSFSMPSSLFQCSWHTRNLLTPSPHTHKHTHSDPSPHAPLPSWKDWCAQLITLNTRSDGIWWKGGFKKATQNRWKTWKVDADRQQRQIPPASI